MENEITMLESRNAMRNPARYEGESFEAYKLRRQINNLEKKQKHHTTFWNSNTQGTYVNKEKKNAKSK
jgi:hypothetical protein